MTYNEKVLKIFKNPRRSGKIAKADAVGEVGNARCGDIMRLYLKIDENEKILDAKFQTFGCVAAIASTETACDMKTCCACAKSLRSAISWCLRW